MGLRDFFQILTLLPPGASVFLKHMSSFTSKFIAKIKLKTNRQDRQIGQNQYTPVNRSGV